jgi:hypothetical protein
MTSGQRRTPTPPYAQLARGPLSPTHPVSESARRATITQQQQSIDMIDMWVCVDVCSSSPFLFPQSAIQPRLCPRILFSLSHTLPFLVHISLGHCLHAITTTSIHAHIPRPDSTMEPSRHPPSLYIPLTPGYLPRVQQDSLARVPFRSCGV